MDHGATPIPNVVIDVWMKHLNPAQFRMALVMLRHGYVGPHALPHSERHRLPRLLALETGTAYRTLNHLLRLGVIRTVNGSDGCRYVLNVGWMPHGHEEESR